MRPQLISCLLLEFQMKRLFLLRGSKKLKVLIGLMQIYVIVFLFYSCPFEICLNTCFCIIFRKKSEMPTKKLISDDQSFQAESQSEESIAGSYSVITYKNRIRLIQMVCLEKQQILQAAKILNIRVSTAKYILRCFRKQGKILKKNCQQEIDEKFYKQQIQILRKKIEEQQTQDQKKRVTKMRKKTKKIEKALTFQTKQQIQEPKMEREQGDEEPNRLKIDGETERQNIAWEGFQNIIYFFLYNPLLNQTTVLHNQP